MSRRRISAVLTALVIGGSTPLLLPAQSASAAPVRATRAGWPGSPTSPATSCATPTASTTSPSTTTRATTRPSAPGTGSRTPAAATPPPTPPPNPGGFVVSEAQFNQMFPNRNSFYTYSGLIAAMSAYPAFANTGSDTVKQAGGRGVPRQRQPRDRRTGPHRRAEHRQLPALLRREPALRLPGRTGRLLRPRPDPAELELQLQGGRRRARPRPAEQPVAGAERRGRRLEDRPLVLEHPERARHDDRRTTRWSTAPASARRSAASTARSSATAATRRRCRAGSPSTSSSPRSSA